MSRTAEFSPCQRKTIFSLVLLTVAFCLIAHFLVEDVFLLRAMGTSTQNYSNTGLAFEMEREDDLVMTIDLLNPFHITIHLPFLPGAFT